MNLETLTANIAAVVRSILQGQSSNRPLPRLSLLFLLLWSFRWYTYSYSAVVDKTCFRLLQLICCHVSKELPGLGYSIITKSQPATSSDIQEESLTQNSCLQYRKSWTWNNHLRVLEGSQQWATEGLQPVSEHLQA